MRLTKLALVAAATLAIPAALSADIAQTGNFFFTNRPDNYRVYGTPDYSAEFSTPFNIVDAKKGDLDLSIAAKAILPNLTGAATIVVDKGATVTVDSRYSSTFGGIFLGDGDFVKNGTGSFQYEGGVATSAAKIAINDSAGTTYYPRLGYFGNASSGAELGYEINPRGEKFLLRWGDNRYAVYDQSNLPASYYDSQYSSTQLLLGHSVDRAVGAPYTYLTVDRRRNSALTSLEGGVTSSFFYHRPHMIGLNNPDNIPHVYRSDLSTANVYTTYAGAQFGNEPYVKLLANSGIYQVKYSDDPNDPEFMQNWILSTRSSPFPGLPDEEFLLPTFRYYRSLEPIPGWSSVQVGDYYYARLNNDEWMFPLGTTFFNGYLVNRQDGSYSSSDSLTAPGSTSPDIGPSMSFSALQGNVTVNAGELDMRGYFNHWREYPAGPTGVEWGYDAQMLGMDKPAMVGAKSWILNGSAKISFRNTDLNTVNASLTLDAGRFDGTNVPAAPDPVNPKTIALNFVHNLQTGRNLSALDPTDPDYREPTKYYTKTYGWDTTYRCDPALLESGDPIIRDLYKPDDVSHLPIQYVPGEGYGPTFTSGEINLPENTISSLFLYLWKEKTEEHVLERYSNDQFNTELEVGTNDKGHRIIVHQDLYWEGSIGIISGVGRFYKTGPGSFSILNKARLDGAVFVAGGQLILDPKVPASGTGQELLLGVSSVNLVGEDGKRGDYMPAELRHTTPPTPLDLWHWEYKMGYVPERETGTHTEKIYVASGAGLAEVSRSVDVFAQLVITGTQTVHNFQALFAESSGASTVEEAIDAAAKANKVEPYIAGQGFGTNVCVDTHRLILQQDVDGVYSGNLNLHWKSMLRDGDVAGLLGGGTIAHTTLSRPYPDLLPDFTIWSEASCRETVVSYHVWKKAVSLLEEKIKNISQVAPSAVGYYQVILDALKGMEAGGSGNHAYGSASLRSQMDSITNPKSISDYQLITIQNIGLDRVDFARVNDLMNLANLALALTRDDLVKYNLGIEEAAARAIREFLVNSTGDVLELHFGLTEKIPAAERYGYVELYMEEIFGAKNAALDIEKAKILLEEGATYVNKGFEQGNANRYNAILSAIVTGRMEDATNLFIAAGTLEKRGKGTLAMLLESSNLSELVISEGAVLANAQGLAHGRVDIQDGELRVLQNNSGTLYATISGTSKGTLIFTTRGYVTNASGVQMLVGQNNAGTVYISKPQSLFHGNVIIEEGVTVQLGAREVAEGVVNPEALNESFSNTNSFVLRGGESNRETTLVMNGSDQKIRNLSGDEKGCIRLGTGILVLDQEYSQDFRGVIRGEGSLVKEGRGDFRLGGVSDFYGVALVREGKLILEAENSLSRASALILKAGATVETQERQTVGALFGEKDSKLIIGNDGLTVGISDTRFEQLKADDQTGPGGVGGLMNMNYLGTYSSLLGGGEIEYALKRPGDINDFLFGDTTQSSRATQGTTLGFLRSPLVELNNAADMAFSGTIKGTGMLIKTGKERLTINGEEENLEFTGITRLDQGILRITANSLNGSPIDINVLPNGANDYLEIYVRSELSARRTGRIYGKGDLHKVGYGEAILDTLGIATEAYTGSIVVEQGRLVITDVNGLPVPTAGNPNAGIYAQGSGTAVFSSTLGAPATYIGKVVGEGGIEKIGTGKVTLSGALDFGHNEHPFAAGDNRQLYSLTALLPEGSTIGTDGSLVLRFPEGSRLLDNGTVEVGKVNLGDGTFEFSGEIFKARNLTGLSEYQQQDAPGVFLVKAKPEGIVVRTQDASGKTILIPLPSDVTLVPSGSDLRDNGTIVTPDGQRLGTHGGVINVANTWADIWLDGERVGGFTFLYETDGSGNKIPKMEPKYERERDSGTGEWSWKLDGSGDRIPELDGDSNPILAHAYAVEMDTDTGLPKLDINGNTIPLHEGVTLLLDPEAWLQHFAVNGLGEQTPLPHVSGENLTLIVSADGTSKTVSNGATVVREGELEIQHLPKLAGQTRAGDFEVLANATLTVNLNTGESQNLESALLGAGLFQKTGTDTLHIAAQQSRFTGTFAINAGAVNLDTANALANASDVLLENGAVLNLNGADQAFHYLSGGVDSVVNVNGSKLFFDVPASQAGDRLYEGLLAGGGTLVKTGEGRLSLWRPADVTKGNELDAIRIEGGSLLASPTALGQAAVYVANGSELDFYTKEGETQNYVGALSGEGIIAKDGAGTVRLGGSASLLEVPAGKEQFLVREGRLIVETARIASFEGRAEVPGARVKTGAVFQLDLTAVKFLTLGANTVVDYAPGEHGSLAIHGPKGTELTIDGTPLGYTGVTELIGGLKLTFDLDRDVHGVDAVATLVGGLSAPKSAPSADTPIVNFGGNQSKVIIVQNLEKTFWGDFSAYATGAKGVIGTAGKYVDYGSGSVLNISGPAKLIYMGGDGKGIIPEGDFYEQNHAQTALGLPDVFGRGVGNVTVDAGHLQVGAENRHAIDVINDGVLYIANYATAPVSYAGRISNSAGDGKFAVHFLPGIEGAGTISLTSQVFSLLDKPVPQIAADAGAHLVLEAAPGGGGRNLNTLFNTEKFTVATGATLEIRAGLNPSNLSDALTLDTAISGEGALLKTGDGRLSINADQQYTGATTVNAGVLGGNFMLTGDLVVDAGGTFAPGNSVGTAGTRKDLVLNPGGTLDLEIEGGARDRILVGGKVVLNGGTIRIIGLQSDIRRGSLLSIAESATEGGRLALEYNAMPTIESGVLDVPNSNENFILVGPGIGVGTPYEGLADGITGVNAADSLAVLVAQKEIAKIPGFNARPGMSGLYSALDAAAMLPVPPVSDTHADTAFRAWYDRNRAHLATLSSLPRDRAAARLAELVKDLKGGLPASVKPERSDPNYKATYDWLKAAYKLGAQINTATLEQLETMTIRLSPLGFSSLAAMPAALANASADNIRARTEQRRYDADIVNDYGVQNHPWQFYFSANATVQRSGGDADAAPYNFHNAGGTVGADARFGKSTYLGGALEYSTGTANMKDGAGRNRMDAVRGTAYASTLLDRNGWFYLDAGAAFGYNTYDTRRNVAGISNTADTDGWNAGVFASLGTVLVPVKAANAEDLQFNITPALTLEYTHHSINSFTESGSHDNNESALRVTGFDMDSLRVKIGTGLQLVWGERDNRWRASLDLSYARELLDTDVEITSRFALDPFGITRNTIHSRALSSEFVQIAPSLTWSFAEHASVFASYRYETSFTGETRHNLSAGFRYRF